MKDIYIYILPPFHFPLHLPLYLSIALFKLFQKGVYILLFHFSSHSLPQYISV